jgi:hypothetical protein
VSFFVWCVVLRQVSLVHTRINTWYPRACTADKPDEERPVPLINPNSHRFFVFQTMGAIIPSIGMWVRIFQIEANATAFSSGLAFSEGSGDNGGHIFSFNLVA